MTDEEGRHRHYSFLKVFDEITTPSINLELLTPTTTNPKHDILPAPSSNTTADSVIVSSRSTIAVPVRKSSKRLKLLGSKLGERHISTPLELIPQKSNPTECHSENKICFSGASYSLNLCDSLSLDCFIDEAFSMSDQRENDRRNVGMVTKQNRYSSRHALQSCSRPVSLNGIFNTHNTAATGRGDMGDGVPKIPSSTERHTEHYEQRDSGDVNEYEPRHNLHSSHGRFKLVQTIKSLNKRSGKKRRMTSEHTATKQHASPTPTLPSEDIIQDIIQSFPIPGQAKGNYNVISRYYRQAQRQCMPENVAVPILTPGNTTDFMLPKQESEDISRWEGGVTYRGFPNSEPLDRSRRQFQRDRPGIPAQDTTVHPIKSNPLRTHPEHSTPNTKRNVPVKIPAYKRASIRTKTLSSPRTSKIRTVLRQVPLMPPTAPPQYPLPRIPQQPKCCDICPQSTFTAVRLIADEPPENDEDLKRRRSRQSSSISIQKKFKKQHRRSTNSTISIPSYAPLASVQYPSSESESDRESEQPSLSPLKLRSKRTKRNAQVHELKKRHSMKQVIAHNSRPRKESFQRIRPSRPRLHNRNDSQTLPEILSKAEYHQTNYQTIQCHGTSLKEKPLKQNLSCSGVWVLIDSDPNNLHGFQAGAVNPGILFSNPWLAAVTKDSTKSESIDRVSRPQKQTRGYHTWQTDASVAPHEPFTVHGGANRMSKERNQNREVPHNRINKTGQLRNEMQQETISLSREMRLMIQRYNPTVSAQQDMSQSGGIFHTALLGNSRIDASTASPKSKSQYPQDEAATEIGERSVEADLNDTRELICPPPSPASTIGVDISLSRSSSPLCRNMSITSNTSRVRKDSDSSLTDPNDYDCLSYSFLTTQSQFTPEELPGSDLPASKATVHSTVARTCWKVEDKTHIENSKIVA